MTGDLTADAATIALLAAAGLSADARIVRVSRRPCATRFTDMPWRIDDGGESVHATDDHPNDILNRGR